MNLTFPWVSDWWCSYINHCHLCNTHLRPSACSALCRPLTNAQTEPTLSATKYGHCLLLLGQLCFDGIASAAWTMSILCFHWSVTSFHCHREKVRVDNVQNTGLGRLKLTSGSTCMVKFRQHRVSVNYAQREIVGKTKKNDEHLGDSQQYISGI